MQICQFLLELVQFSNGSRGSYNRIEPGPLGWHTLALTTELPEIMQGQTTLSGVYRVALPTKKMLSLLNK